MIGFAIELRIDGNCFKISLVKFYSLRINKLILTWFNLTEISRYVKTIVCLFVLRKFRHFSADLSRI